ncbi:MAG: ADP-ribosylglycohydrolase family protein [Anaerocolumna sp.]
MRLDSRYMDRIYGGFIGKVIGVIHGANTEGWTYEQIKNTLGTISDYPFTFNNFCSDDDINGPVFYMRAVKDFEYDKNLAVDKMAHTMANYVADGHGFFWWGGYGISTEYTAYYNVMNGIPAPRSGSIEQNGKTVAEQIGGQIFSDCWGLICPGDPALAAELAGKMSSVTHGGNGIYGGMFLAACIAKAFSCKDMKEIIETGLSYIPPDCEYSVVARDVMQYAMESDDWEQSFLYVKEKYGYQHYEGVCHIIPNAAVIILSLIHGENDFSRTINICNMCGWDTDCNVGNVGTILGVMSGVTGIEEKWLTQVNDFVCASSCLGYLNIQTVSQMAALASEITHKMYGIGIEGVWKDIFSHPEGKYFHFEFPTATHAMRCHFAGNKKIRLYNTEEEAFMGKRSLKIVVPAIKKANHFFLYYKSYYTPEDFEDSRYDPDFSPTVYPGDKVSMQVKLSELTPAKIRITPYIKDRLSNEVIELTEESRDSVKPDEWTEILFHIPKLKDTIVEEVGIRVSCADGYEKRNEFPLILYLDDMCIDSNSKIEMNLGKLPVEKWNVLHECPAYLTYLRGIVRLQDEALMISGYGKPSEAYTGNLDWKDYLFTAELVPVIGEKHNLLFRVQGGMRCYAAGLSPDNKFTLYKKAGTYQILCEIDFNWEYGQSYNIQVRVINDHISVYEDNTLLFEYTDADQPYLNGCIGFGNDSASRTAFRKYTLTEEI